MFEGITWPSWIGTPSQLGLLLVVTGSIVLGYIKVLPKLLELKIGERASNKDRYTARVKELKEEVKACRDECDAQERRLQDQIDLLKTKINNEAWQRVQSEISLVHTLIQVVDAPQLKIILAALKQRSSLIPPEILEGAGNDDIEGA